MKWSLKLGRFAGIDVFVHWTFALLVGWVFLAYLGAGQSVVEALVGVLFVLVLFVCIVLHEYGHALTARRYGVGTQDITLLPIGGVARLEKLPENPIQEFWVAIAGPAVNLVIAAVLCVVLAAMNGMGRLLQLDWMEAGFLKQLMWVNLFVVAFNMLPAFPMDGGRVLRALLAARMGRRRATEIAAGIGQAFAILLGVWGFFVNPILIFIAIFVYLGAQAEASQVRAQSVLGGFRVRDGMMTRYRTLAIDDSLGRATEELLAGSQHDFPVLDEGRIRGVLVRNELVKALADGRRDARVGDLKLGDGVTVEAADPLLEALEKMREHDSATAPVLDNGRMVGLLTMENVGELMMVQSAMGERGGGR